MESKRHNQILKVPILSTEDHHSFVNFTNTNQVIGSLEVKLDHGFVYTVIIIDTWAQRNIFLFHKKKPTPVGEEDLYLNALSRQRVGLATWNGSTDQWCSLGRTTKHGTGGFIWQPAKMTAVLPTRNMASVPINGFSVLL